MQALGIDVSNYNKLVTWSVAFARGVKYAGMRASISYAYRDPFITRNLAEAHKLGIHCLPYGVLYPGEDPKAQADNFLAACGDVWGWAWPVIDMELDHGQTEQRITDTMLSWLQLVEAGCGRRPIIYSRKYWIQDHTTAGDWLTKYQWWLANYLEPATSEKPSPPTLPAGVTSWLIHQNSDLIPAWPGLNGPDGIATCDIDRWNGDNAAVDKFFGVVTPPPVPQPDLREWATGIDAWARKPVWMRYSGYAGPKPPQT